MASDHHGKIRILRTFSRSTAYGSNLSWLMIMLFGFVAYILSCITNSILVFAFTECGRGRADCDQRVLNACRHVEAEVDTLQAAGTHLIEVAGAAQVAAKETLLRTVEQAIACFFHASRALEVAAILDYHCLEANCRVTAEFYLTELVQSATPLCQDLALGSGKLLYAFKQWLWLSPISALQTLMPSSVMQTSLCKGCCSVSMWHSSTASLTAAQLSQPPTTCCLRFH